MRPIHGGVLTYLFLLFTVAVALLIHAALCCVVQKLFDSNLPPLLHRMGNVQQQSKPHC